MGGVYDGELTSWSMGNVNLLSPLTIRTYYPGEHQITIIVNGKQLAKASIILEM